MANTNEDNVIEKLEKLFSEKYVKPNPVYAALTDPKIDAVIQLAKKNKYPNKDILDELKKALPDNSGVQAAELVHIRSYPSKLKKTNTTTTTTMAKKDESKKAKQAKTNGASRKDNNSNSGNATSSTTNTPVEQPHPEQKAPGNAGVAGSSGLQSGKTEEAANKVNANGATV